MRNCGIKTRDKAITCGYDIRLRYQDSECQGLFVEGDGVVAVLWEAA